MNQMCKAISNTFRALEAESTSKSIVEDPQKEGLLPSGHSSGESAHPARSSVFPLRLRGSERKERVWGKGEERERGGGGSEEREHVNCGGTLLSLITSATCQHCDGWPQTFITEH